MATYTTTLASNGGTAWDMTSTPSTTSTAPSNTWFIFDGFNDGTTSGNTRPMLMMEYSTNVTNNHQLQLMGSTLGASYTLGNDIDLSNTYSNTSDVWGAGATGMGFVSIGTSTNYFTGSLDGQNHTISNLYVNGVNNPNNGVKGGGLFNQIQNATLQNIVISNPIVIA
jgi:hypothetical protein